MLFLNMFTALVEELTLISETVLQYLRKYLKLDSR